MGLLHGLETSDGPEDGVDDPEALRRAEEAVAHDDRSPGGSLEHIDERWASVATGGTGGVPALVAIASTLEGAGVPVGWDPYAPSEAVGFMWPGTETRIYTVQVPVSQLTRARDSLPGSPLPGVTYAWNAVSDAPPVSVGDAGLSGSASARSSAAGSGADASTSDNRRLEHLSGSRPSLVMIAGRVLIGLALIGLLLLVFGRLLG
jgi:hypothetical protein